LDRPRLYFPATAPSTDITLIQGACPTGADAIAHEIALDMGWTAISEPADWNMHGKAAGPIRNQKMIDDYRPNIALFFNLNNSRGTNDCLRRLKLFAETNPCRIVIETRWH
jgi:hypothetical protein